MIDSRQIVEKVGSLFKKFGIKSITMDDVSRELGVSKKTLYQLVADKNELIQLVLNTDFRAIENRLNAVNNEEEDAILQLINIQSLIIYSLSSLSLAVDYDLRKYHSDIYEGIREEYLNLFRTIITQNIERGKSQGLYRNDIDEKVITKYHLNQIDQIPHSKLITKREFTSGHFVQEICTFHLYGIVNEKGRQLLEQYRDKIEMINKSEVI
jgi:TetR/AcrR family transcriptional regulator, cholesterol catabolism regulator